ncbi:NifB/NifX family molybdenum-iron cluster-binding protein [Desulfogranum japonicum]|uniref:NifB/NifX family molybdenum-iron cluster-binding protein n=1 Tax=Desulfogranum japonicum TaxID=231447 RepID=UPI000416A78B|nr:hypothetical protein [Desulfogranum japonicum]
MKILITIRGDYVSPRFDLCAEAIIATCYDRQLLDEPRSIILDHMSAEVICDLALKENVSILVCGGIEEQHYQFLTWKGILVIDGIIGPHDKVLQEAVDGTLSSHTVFEEGQSRRETT